MFTVSTNSKEKLSPALLEKARTLRKTATAAEVFLWQILRRRKLNGLKFRRQHPLQRGFILDFYCDELKLGIELDGAIHNSKIQSEYDRLRTIEINFQAINIIRFRNEEILDNTEYVLDSILKFSINK